MRQGLAAAVASGDVPTLFHPMGKIQSSARLEGNDFLRLFAALSFAFPLLSSPPLAALSLAIRVCLTSSLCLVCVALGWG